MNKADYYCSICNKPKSNCRCFRENWIMKNGNQLNFVGDPSEGKLDGLNNERSICRVCGWYHPDIKLCPDRMKSQFQKDIEQLYNDVFGEDDEKDELAVNKIINLVNPKKLDVNWSKELEILHLRGWRNEGWQ